MLLILTSIKAAQYHENVLVHMLLAVCVVIFSSPGRSPGRAITTPALVSAGLAKSLTLNFFILWARHC